MPIAYSTIYNCPSSHLPMTYQWDRKGWEEFGVARKKSQSTKDDLQHLLIVDQKHTPVIIMLTWLSVITGLILDKFVYYIKILF